MDRIDLGIFSRLVGNPYLSDETLAREVGLSGKAVRLRRKRMEEQGVLAEYGVHPSAEILGRYALTWRYEGKDWADVPDSRLSEVPDLAYVMSFRPNLHLAVRFTKTPDAQADPRLSKLLGRLLDETPDERTPQSSVRADALSRLDWKVLEAVVQAPRASYSVQARSAELSPRTLRIHKSKLEATNALQCVMILNLEREAGLATYGIWLKVDGSFDARAVELPRLWDRPHWTQHPRGVYLLGSAENYFEARELELRLRSLPGVVGADPLIPAGGWFARSRFLAWIRAERDRRFPSAVGRAGHISARPRGQS